MILIIFYLPILLFGQTPRWDFIESIQNTKYKGTDGTWRDSIYCPDDSWMGGLRLYSNTLGISAAGYDKKGLYFVELRCFDTDGALKASVQSLGEDLGDAAWSDDFNCPGKKNFINRFSQSVAPDEGVNGLWVGCFGDYKLDGITGYNKIYNPVTWCPSETAVCGIKSKFESDQGSNLDDSALNDIELHCCRYCEKDLSRFMEKESKICKSCFYKCKTCSGGKYNECSSCFTREKLINNQCLSENGSY